MVISHTFNPDTLLAEAVRILSSSQTGLPDLQDGQYYANKLYACLPPYIYIYICIFTLKNQFNGN